MKTVKQPAEIAFNALDFADKVVMLPIMDAVAQTTKDKEDVQICLDLESAKRIFKVLSDIGCRTSQGESYEDVIKSCNSQKELHKIFFKNPGINRVQVIKILKENLNLGLKEAKDLSDSYPTIIDLDVYKIERSEYLGIFNLLKEVGAAIEIVF